MDGKSVDHSLSGALGDLKSTATGSLGKGLSVAAGILGTDLLLSRVLKKDGRPLVPANLGPLGIAGLGVVLGWALDRYGSRVPLINKLNPDMVAAGAVGVAIAGFAGKLLSPTLDASSEAATAQPNAPTAGFGFGRAFAGAGGGLGNFYLPNRKSLYATGVRDLSAANMFHGANVQLQETGARGFQGATVQFEQNGAMAGVLTN